MVKLPQAASNAYSKYSYFHKKLKGSLFWYFKENKILNNLLD